MVFQYMMELAEKAVLQGALTGGGSFLVHGRQNIVTPVGTYPLWMVTSGIGTVSAVSSDLLHQYVFEEIPVNKKVRHNLSLVLSAVTSGLFYNLGLGIVNPDLPKEFGMLPGLAVGGGAELVSGLVLDMIR